LTNAIDAGYVHACHDLSEGGLAVSLAEMAFTGGLGLEVDIGKVRVTEEIREDLLLFSESNGRLLVEISPRDARDFEKLMNGSIMSRIGSIIKEPSLKITKKSKTVLKLDNEKMIQAWKTPLEARR
jgi:phosphoribosylformylglycinamidine (FGAM) synthase-like enzyme